MTILLQTVQRLQGLKAMATRRVRQAITYFPRSSLTLASAQGFISCFCKNQLLYHQNGRINTIAPHLLNAPTWLSGLTTVIF